MFERDAKVSKQELSPTLGKFLGEIETPAVVLSSFLGNPLFTTPDALNEEKDQYLCQLDVVDLVFKDFKDMELTKLYKSFSTVNHILSARISGKKYDSNCDASGMSVDTHNGRKPLTVQNYVERAIIDKPKVVIALADEINQTLGKKRLKKAIERTATWFQNYITFSAALGVNVRDFNAENSPFLFGVAQYDHSYTLQMPLFIKNMLTQGARGIVIGNAHLGESDAQRTDAIKAIKELLPAEVPTLIQGADSLDNILLALSFGIDLISSDYPHALSTKGHALALSPAILCLNHDAVSTQNTLDKRTFSDTNNDTSESSSAQASNKRQRINVNTTSENHKEETVDTERVNLRQGQSSHGGTPPAVRCEINLWDVKYSKDTRPLVEGCSCHACRHHTRAYIHHLHICKEMLAEVLLHHHNVHQLLQLFKAARQQVHIGTFDKWLQQIRECM